MSSRDINDLREDIRAMATIHRQLCKMRGVDLLIYCTLRSNEEQDALYAVGRKKPGRIVTNARAGQSKHNPDKNGKSRAYDCVPLRHGKAVWGTRSKEDSGIWAIVVSCGEEAGLEAAARWTGKLKEMCHFQVS